MSPVSSSSFANKKASSSASGTVSRQNADSAAEKGPRRALDFSQLDVHTIASEAAAAQIISTVGGLTRQAKVLLAKSLSGKIELEVKITAAAVRFSDPSATFMFVVFADHTGYVSLGGKPSTFDEIHAMDETKKSEAVRVFNLHFSPPLLLKQQTLTITTNALPSDYDFRLS